MKKRGQYYLIAGIIILSILIGFLVIVNYTKKGSTDIVEDMGDELKIETQKVLEYDLVQGEEKMRQFGKDYSTYVGSDIELYFITGENPNIKAYKYFSNIEIDVTEDLTIDEVEDKIFLEIDEIAYEFELTSGENFYFLVSKEIEEERFVATG